MLQLQAISKSFVAGSGDCRTAVRVLDDVCLTISSGQIVVVSGRAGCGKSTLLECMAGLRQQDAGVRRLLAGGAVHYWAGPYDWRRAGLRDHVGASTLHLFDEPGIADFSGARAEFAAALRRLRASRQAVVIATSAPLRDLVAIIPRAARYYHLERGRLTASLRQYAPAVAVAAQQHARAFG